MRNILFTLLALIVLATKLLGQAPTQFYEFREEGPIYAYDPINQTIIRDTTKWIRLGWQFTITSTRKWNADSTLYVVQFPSALNQDTEYANHTNLINVNDTSKYFWIDSTRLVLAIKNREVRPTSRALCDIFSFKFGITTDEDELVPDEQFEIMKRKTFTALTGGQSTTAPGVGAFGLELLDAKFNIKGSLTTKSGSYFANFSLSGDKEGNTATLFEDKKTGGKFQGEVSLGFGIGETRFYSPEEKIEINGRIDAADYNYYKHSKHCCDLELDSCEDDAINRNNKQDYYTASLIAKLQSLNDSADAKRNAIYQSAKWTSMHRGWLAFRFGLGGDKVYSAKNTYTFLADTVVTNKLLTMNAGAEINYYYSSQERKLSLLINAGAGYERTNNLIDLEKFTVSESSSTTDTIIKTPSSHKRDFSVKYDAYSGNVTNRYNFLSYINLFGMYGEQQGFGIHLGAESRNNLLISDKSYTSLMIGVITSTFKKADSKSILNVELYYKVNGTVDDITRLKFGSNRQSEIGLTFNIPFIPQAQKAQ